MIRWTEANGITWEIRCKMEEITSGEPGMSVVVGYQMVELRVSASGNGRTYLDRKGVSEWLRDKPMITASVVPNLGQYVNLEDFLPLPALYLGPEDGIQIHLWDTKDLEEWAKTQE